VHRSEPADRDEFEVGCAGDVQNEECA